MNSGYGSGGTGLESPHQTAQLTGGNVVSYAYDVRGNQTSKSAPSAIYSRTIAYSLDDHLEKGPELFTV
jgi:hypothetical protein